jgi:enterochelin esterase-like enzyme
LLPRPAHSHQHLRAEGRHLAAGRLCRMSCHPTWLPDRRVMWFSTGTDDFLIDNSRATVAMLKRHGFAVTFQESSGAHTWVNWRHYLYEFAPQLFR